MGAQKGPAGVATGAVLARTLVATVIAVMGAGPGASAVQPDPQDECVRRLLAAPVDSVPIPGDWAWWGPMSLGEHYWELLPSFTALTGRLGQDGGDHPHSGVQLTLGCQPETALVMDRTAEVWTRFGARSRPVAPIGDASLAVETEDGTTILWRTGGVIGWASISDPTLPFTAVETLARDMSHLLADAGLEGGSPTTREDACVRHLATAPLETLWEPLPMGGRTRAGRFGISDRYLGPASTALPSVTPSWTGDGGAIHVGCEPEAALLMERAAQVARHFGATVLDVQRIGDASIAWETPGEPDESPTVTLLWRYGDILGEIRSARPWTPEPENPVVERARDLQGLLAAGGPAPVAGVSDHQDACLQRLLRTPLEEVDAAWEDLRLGWHHAAPTWVASTPSSLSLSCEPNAVAILDRARAGWSDPAPSIAGGPGLGDAALVMEDGVAWRNGDVLGIVAQGMWPDPTSAVAFARRIDALLGAAPAP